MEKPQEEFREIKAALREEIREFISSQHSRLGNLSNWDNEGLLAMDQIFAFFCADAVIRLRGLVEEQNLKWLTLYEEALDFAAQPNIDILARGYVETHDAKSIRGLIIAHLDRAATLGEFNKRVESLRIGNKVINYIHGESKGFVGPLLK